MLLIETIFDTLNAKAAIFAIEESSTSAGVDAAGHDLRHHHRPLRPHAVRPDGGGVLELGAPCRAVRRRAQLRAGRRGDARPYRRARRASPTRWSAPIPMPACPTSSASTTRARKRWPRMLGEFAACGLRQYRRRLLRHHAGAHPRHRRGGRRHGAARDAGGRRTCCGCPGWSRSRSTPDNPLRQCRRAHQRHRLGASSAS